MKKSKIISLFLAGAMCLAVGCSSGSEDNLSLKPSGDPVAFTLDGVEIPSSQFAFSIQSGFLEMQSYYQMFGMEPMPMDQDSFDYSKEYAIDIIKQTYAIDKLIEKHELVATQEILDLVDNDIAEAKEYMGEESFLAALADMGVTEEFYREDSIRGQVFQDAIPLVYGNATKTDEELYEIYSSEEFMKAQHILVSFETVTETLTEEDSKNNALEKINAILEDVTPENFDSLMLQHNEDPGQPASGYAFTEGTMVAEFEAGVLALEDNEISDIVETSYGYHIIKRVAPNEANFEDNLVSVIEGNSIALASADITEIATALEMIPTDEFEKITLETYEQYLVTN